MVNCYWAGFSQPLFQAASRREPRHEESRVMKASAVKVKLFSRKRLALSPRCIKTTQSIAPLQAFHQPVSESMPQCLSCPFHSCTSQQASTKCVTTGKRSIGCCFESSWDSTCGIDFDGIVTLLKPENERSLDKLRSSKRVAGDVWWSRTVAI